MKEIKIKIYGWSDLKKWFWDRFCFPRRELVAEWLLYGEDKKSNNQENDKQKNPQALRNR